MEAMGGVNIINSQIYSVFLSLPKKKKIKKKFNPTDIWLTRALKINYFQLLTW